MASYYGPEDSGGDLACTGQPLSYVTIGVANKTLPCFTKLRICAVRCVDLRVLDRGPYVGGRDFDLTIGAARRMGFSLSAGVGPVRYALR